MRKVSEDGLRKINEARQRGIETSKKKKEQRIKEYYENPKCCKTCGNPIRYEVKTSNDYCSHVCGGYHDSPIKKPRNNCLNCGKMCKNIHSIYCSTRCWRQLQSKKSDIIIESDKNVGQRMLRKYLMKKQDSKCSKCGWGEINPISLTVCLDLHHKDGDSNNNVLSNVELICPNCHSLTDTYKKVGKERKSSRNKRRK